MRAIRDGESSAALLVGMAMAFLYGVFHALGPGHGKFVVASYFLSREARIWRGFLMGVQIALTHVVSAVALLWLADISLRHVLGGPAADFKPLKLLSYSATGAVGVLLFVRAARRTEPIQGHHHPRETGQGHRGGWVQALASVGVGLIPCTGALLVMLYAVANEMIPTGMVLILAIAAGMAITMSGLGVLTILARHRVLGWAESSDRRPSRTRWVLEIGGAVVLTVFSSLLLIGSL
jgi:ABC-type nickel/cobalt efflux system permease component RcnA